MTSRRKPPAAGPLPIEPQPIVAPLPVLLLDAPLEYVLADHDRQRRVTAALRRMGERGSVDRPEADTIREFLRHDLPLHHEDEDTDLFPAVRRRAAPSDDLADVLTRLSQDHTQSVGAVASIVAALSVDGDLIRLPAAARSEMLDYVHREQRHLAIENGIVMVIARRRLTASDIRRISQGMKARRGVP